MVATVTTALPDSGSLRLWQRFHVRLTLLYAIAVFGVLCPMAGAFYVLGVDQELTALRTRLRATTVALASAGLAEDALALRSEADRGSPAFARLEARLAAVSRVDAEIRNLYILLRTEEHGLFRFAIDHDRDRPQDSARIGQRYDARPFPLLIAALDAPQVEAEPTVDAWGPSLAGWAPLRDRRGLVVGVVGIDVLGARIEATRRQVLAICGGLAVLALALLGAAAVVVGRNVEGPLGRLIEVTGRIAAGDLDARLALQRRDEFGTVSARFDAMAEGLQDREFIRDTFGRYVSEEVARSLLTDRSHLQLGGEVREVTVLFTDLRGYSTISERLSPGEVVDLLNRYLGEMNDVIDAHHGVIIEFLGDAILAVFNAPGPLADHAAWAVRCAEAMAQRLEALNATWEAAGLAHRWQQAGLDRLRQRIGVHCGPVVAGNLGSHKRAKYAVIGDTVNVAARLEQANKEIGVEGTTALLFSGAVRAALPPELQARCLRRGDLSVKGRAQVVEAWTLAPAAVSGDAIAAEPPGATAIAPGSEGDLSVTT